MIGLNDRSRTPMAVTVAVLAAYLLGGATVDISSALASSTSTPRPLVRTAVVQADPPPTASAVTVLIDGGDTHRLPYQTGYVPVPGDRVNVLLLSGSGAALSGIVLGGQAGQTGNLVINGDFTRIPPASAVNTMPYLWGQYRVSGSTTAIYSLPLPAFMRPVMRFDSVSETAGENYAYTAPFSVVPGETINAEMLVKYDIFGTVTLNADLRLAWFANDTSVYPSQISDIAIATYTPFTSSGDAYYQGSATVPSGANFARVAVRVQHTCTGGSFYSFDVGWVNATR